MEEGFEEKRENLFHLRWKEWCPKKPIKLKKKFFLTMYHLQRK